ncbi:MAG TPA: hypothetical protein VFW96_09615 [Thermomicrobiales bacterium]|nr:hypothetical protein [Thermomicrobiales bacterium]
MRVSMTPPREGWLRNGLLAGLVATGVMTVTLGVAYAFALNFGGAGGNIVAQWLWSLTHNRVTAAVSGAPFLFLALQLSMGLALSLVYAGVAEPALGGPAWRRGALFALAPWLCSLVVFLPLVGGGIAGAALGAGPLPALGNLIVHLVYGATLGAVYAIPETAGLDRTAEDEGAAIGADRGAAVGIVAGVPLGTVCGALVAALGGASPLLPTGALLLAGALIGGAWGGLIGSLAGIDRAVRAGRIR